MSNRAINRARAIKDVNPAAKLIAILLADSKNETTGQCFPSIPRLVADSCLSESGVKLAIRELERLGLVRRKFDQKKNRTEYHLLFDEGGHSVTPLSDPEGGHSLFEGGSLSDVRGSVSNPKPEVTRKENQKKTMSADADTERKEFFEIFWREMPKRRTASKREAWQAWKNHIKPADYKPIIEAAMAYTEEKEQEAARRKCAIVDAGLMHPCRFITKDNGDVWKRYANPEEEAA